MDKELEANVTLSHYRIIRKIGAGGMGEVFLAEDTRLDRKVAIKFLNEEFSRDADKLNRFIREAKSASALNHPNILTVHEIGETDDSNYIVTEFIEGETLREHLSAKEIMPLNQILKIGVQTAEALSTAHQAGIIHRDIKPENIMIRADGYAKVLDFGLAKLTERKNSDKISLEGETKAFVQTNPGVVMGTVNYMSPEQARGRETDARTDVWSLGVVLYEMLAGKLPFTGETINHMIVSILEKEPLLLENVPDELQRIVRKALTKDKEMRYQTMRDLLIDLKNLRRNLDIQGELERSIIPNRETISAPENETRSYSQKSIEETRGEKPQKATNASSLEYAVTQAKSHKLATAIVGIVLLGIISAVAYFAFFAKSNAGQVESIAVLPFQNEGGEDTEYLSDGMTETLIGSLSQIPKLNVKARSSVFRYKGKEIDVPKIARELNAQAILTGRIARRGEQFVLNLELVDAATENVIWAEQYTRKQSDLTTLQSEIARDVSNKLRTRLSGAEASQIAKNYTQNAEAYQLYLKGRFYWNKRTEADINRSIEYFNQAIALDPTYALAYAGLADAYQVLPNYTDNSPLEGTYSKARGAAQKALEIDSNLAEPHATLGVVLHEYDWNFGEAEKEFKKAIELNPNYASAHQWYSEYLGNMGRLDEAVAEAKRAQQLDPLSLIINTVLGGMYYFSHRYDEAIAQYKKTLEIDPNFPRAYRQMVYPYFEKGMYEEAIEAGRKSRLLQGLPPEQVENRTAAVREAYRKGGVRGFWQKVLELEQEVARKNNTELSPITIAFYQVRMGNKEQALDLLEKAFADGRRELRLVQMKTDPIWYPIRPDPRFQELLRKIGFPS
ncbi:MAG TPA: protein kinase [Pyrinomonadaceae bacterium]